MEVKSESSLYKSSRFLSPESLAKEYFEDHSNSLESPPSKFLKDSANLLNCEEKTEAGILKSLNKRISMGVPYTSIGKDLIAVNCDYPGSWYFNKEVKSNNMKSKPHPYNISLNAYSKLKESHENQVITTLGVCGSGKTFNAIHVLDHLIQISTEDFICGEDICLSLFENMHKSIQLLHIMASVCKKRNLESTTCALDVKVMFDSSFRCTGGSVTASLIDFSLPCPKKGRTYQMLHSLMYCDPNTIKILGLSPKLPSRIFDCIASDLNFRIFDTEVNQRFFECLNFLDVSLSEKKSFLEVLTSVINLYEIDFVRKGPSLEPKNRWVLRKICKSLGMAEATFTEKFLIFPTKDECESRCRDLARFLYSKAFDWLGSKVNKKLKRVSEFIIEQRKQFQSCNSSVQGAGEDFSSKFSINILDFPGFNKEKTLGGLIKNLAFESLNYYCSGNYLKLLQQLKTEKILVQGMKESKCKQVIEFFLQNTSTLASLFAADKEFKQEWSKVRKEADGLVLRFVDEDLFDVEFTNGVVRYSLKSLRTQATQIFFNEFNESVAAASSLEILARKGRKAATRLEEVFTKSLRKILFPYLDQTPFVIYCLKSESKAINRNSLKFLRNTTVFPNLIWNWFGFSHWLRAGDVAKELGIEGANISQVKQELMKKFNWKNVQTSQNFILLKTSQMNEFKGLINKGFKTTESTISDISMSLSLFSLSPDLDFNYTIHEDSTHRSAQASVPTSIPHPFSYIDIDKLQDDSDLLTQATSKSKTSLNTSFNDSLILMRPNSSPQVLRTVNYKMVDYSNIEDKIETIQRLWRGHRDREYTRALKHLHYKAKLIQSAWRGFNVRKNFGPVLVYQKAAFVIQKYWKLFCLRRKIAARVIQRWFRFVVYRNQQRNLAKLGYVSSKKMVQEGLSKYEGKLKKKIEKKIGSGKTDSIREETKTKLDGLRSRNLVIKKNLSGSGSGSGLRNEEKNTANSFKYLESPSATPSESQASSARQTQGKLQAKAGRSGKSNSSSFVQHSVQSYSSGPNSKFTPTLSKLSQYLAREKYSQFSELSVLDRFKILEANRVEKIHKMRQEKLETETFTHVPTVHKNENIRNSFAERQEKYLKNAKAKIEMLSKVKIDEKDKDKDKDKDKGIEREKIGRRFDGKEASRSPDQVVNELNRWAKLRDKKIEVERQKKVEKEESEMGDYRVGENSLLYSTLKKFRLEKGKEEDRRERKDNSPYWPRDS